MPTLTQSDSQALKGIALLLLLCHHLFACPPAGVSYADFGFAPLVRWLGVYGKACVALFVLLSGYGLMRSTGGAVSYGAFCRRRLGKLWLGYWAVWMVFVPLGVWGFGRTFADAYGEHIVRGFVLDFFGLLNLTGDYGYNPTWWFYSCIIPLYLLFPLLRSLWLRHAAVFRVALCMCLIMSALRGGGGLPRLPFADYVAAFMLGIAQASPRSAGAHKGCGGRWPWLWLGALSALAMVSARLRAPAFALLAANVCVCYAHVRPRMGERFAEALASCGRHSCNIFLFHTFFYFYFFPDFIYAFRWPPLIFAALLALCLAASWALEWMKERLGFYQLQNFITKI